MISRGLAYLSTVIHVRCLNFRVRNGNGCDTPAVAAIESQIRVRTGMELTCRHPCGRFATLAWLDCVMEMRKKYSPAFMDFVWV